jgi:hypothetical protein
VLGVRVRAVAMLEGFAVEPAAMDRGRAGFAVGCHFDADTNCRT